MVFLSGPRQCGKTTLAKDILKTVGGAYLNWDHEEHRRLIVTKSWRDDDRLLVLDELHKRPKWKQWLKGLYDVEHEQHQFLVTGSARLDVYRRGGDSLLGRYHHWRLHPFTLDELPKKLSAREAFARLMRVGGFPEPFLDGDEAEARRWRTERYQRVLREDVRDLESVGNTQGMMLFLDLLRRRVGGLVVLANLATDLQISPNTAKNWLEVLERMYVVFVVRPLVRGVARSIIKPPKVYFFDNADVIGDEGARFENLVATHLYKWLQWYQDRDGYRYELHYIRDRDGHEVDFVITREDQVWALVEAKWNDPHPTVSLRHFAERLKPKTAYQLVGTERVRAGASGLRIGSALELLTDPRRVLPVEA
jgi:predicted AAA+ superfamily ATPase